MSLCSRWVLTGMWLVATAMYFGLQPVGGQLTFTEDNDIDIDDDLEDMLMDRRSLNELQSSSGEGMCRWVMCPPSSICRLRTGGRARCVCRPCDASQLRSGPVCGYDGRTYTTACKLQRSNCRASQHTAIDYVGPCQTSCAGVMCSAGKSCIVDQLGLPHCLRCDVVNYCPWDSADTSPVCGADGHTYYGPCRLLEAACEVGRSVRLAYYGPCLDGLTCDKLECDGGRQCVMNLLTSTPMCVDCTRPCYTTSLPGVGTSYQLCGTDGQSYRDWCSVVQETCSRRVLIETLHFGPCQGENE